MFNYKCYLCGKDDLLCKCENKISIKTIEGSVILNSNYYANIIKKYNDIILLELEIITDYFNVNCTEWSTIYGLGLHIGKCRRSNYINKNFKRDTIIYFIEFDDWEIHSYKCSKHSLDVCLIKSN